MRNPGGWEILVINVVGCREERIAAIRGVTPRSYVHILDTPQSYIWTSAEIWTSQVIFWKCFSLPHDRCENMIKFWNNQNESRILVHFTISPHYYRVIDLNLKRGITYWGKMNMYSVICSSVRYGVGERWSYVRNEPFAGFPWHNSWGQSRLQWCTGFAGMFADIKEISPLIPIPTLKMGQGENLCCAQHLLL